MFDYFFLIIHIFQLMNQLKYAARNMCIAQLIKKIRYVQSSWFLIKGVINFHNKLIIEKKN